MAAASSKVPARKGSQSDSVNSQQKIVKDSSKGTPHGKSRTQLHLIRKVFHAATGSGFAALYEYFLDKHQALLFYGVLFIILFVGEILRMKFPDTINRLALRVTQSLLRSYEKDHASGMVYFVAGMIFCVGLLPKNIAVLSILFLSIGDPVASACGIRFGSLGPKFGNGKSLIGYLGGLLACAIITYFYFARFFVPSNSLYVVSLIGGFAGKLISRISITSFLSP